jgi:glutamine synthetase
MEKKDRQEGKDYVLKMAREHNVKFVELWFTDIRGMLKSYAIPVSELEGAIDNGMGFDGSSIEGFSRIDESDMMSVPDLDTFQLLPWKVREDVPLARMFCDIRHPGGLPFEGDPRQVLKRNLKKATELGFTYYVGPELEYFYFKDEKKNKELNEGGYDMTLSDELPFANRSSLRYTDEGGYYDMTLRDAASELRNETVLALEEMGIGVDKSHHEVARSQHEIDMRYTDALTMADQVMTYRLVVKEIAARKGWYATFMPKPIFGINGSGMHVHQSLFKNGKNAFFDKNGLFHLSKTAQSFVAGLLKYAPEFTAVTNQWINSYKRLVPGYEAPVYLSWAIRNRSDLVRVPGYEPGKENATRFEIRSPDPACNPYLCFSVLLAAGLKGIEEGLEPPAPAEGNVYHMTPLQRKKLGIGTLPASLDEAIQLMEKSALVKETLGEHTFNAFLENKKIEWDKFRTRVTDYEISEYLPIL